MHLIQMKQSADYFPQPSRKSRNSVVGGEAMEQEEGSCNDSQIDGKFRNVSSEEKGGDDGNEPRITKDHQRHDDSAASGMIDHHFGFSGGKACSGKGGKGLKLPRGFSTPVNCNASTHENDDVNDTDQNNQ